MSSQIEEHLLNTDFQAIPIEPLISELLNTSPNDDAKDDCSYLQFVEKDKNTEQILNILQHPFFYCWITPSAIIDKTQFVFQFNLFIDYKNESVCKYEFIATFNQIHSIYQKAKKNRKCFPVQQFPIFLPQTLQRRSDKLKNEMALLDKYSYLENEMRSADGHYICIGPGKCNWWSSKMRKAKESDMKTLSFILCKLFNSPSYCCMDKAFGSFMTKCGILDAMTAIIQSKAFLLLTSLRRKTLHFTVKNKMNEHDQLIEDETKKKMKFHTLTVCARPVNGVKNVSLIDHWSLKFEGDDDLLTLDYYANSKVFAIVDKNDCFGQRVFWYSWCANSKQLFTQRWGTLSKIYFDKSMQAISGECIGQIITKWKSKYNEYCSMTNNCQHFVRDIMTIFSFNAAKYLSTKFHHRVVEGIIFPSLPFLDEIDEQKRMKQICAVLHAEFERFHIVQNEDENDDDDFKESETEK